MICKYEGGQSLSAIAHEIGLAVSTVKTIMKDASHIKEHVNAVFHLIYIYRCSRTD
jgi:hypothetical protein